MGQTGNTYQIRKTLWIRRLEDLTGMDATTIPLDDPEVMSLFHSTDILGITPEDIGGIVVASIPVKSSNLRIIVGSSWPRISSFNKL